MSDFEHTVKKIIPFHIKLILVVLAIVFVLLVNPFGETKRGKLQHDFDSWLKVSNEVLTHPAEGKAPVLHMILKSNTPGRVFSWELQASDDSRLNEKIVRLLRQAREANLFQYDEDRNTEITLEVKDGEKTFLSRFNEADIQNNVKAVIFLKLFEEYSSSPNTVDSSSNGAS